MWFLVIDWQDACHKKNQERAEQQVKQGPQAQARGPPPCHPALWIPRRGQDNPPQADPPQQGWPQSCCHRQWHGWELRWLTANRFTDSPLCFDQWISHKVENQLNQLSHKSSIFWRKVCENIWKLRDLSIIFGQYHLELSQNIFFEYRKHGFFQNLLQLNSSLVKFTLWLKHQWINDSPIKFWWKNRFFDSPQFCVAVSHRITH